MTALGLRPGDAKILRNAGGRVTDDVIRSLAVAVALLGVERIAVMHHTSCAMAGRTDEQLRAAGVPGDTWLGAMPDPVAALAEDVDALRRSSLIPAGVAVAGWVYDVHDGLIRPTDV